MVVVIIISLIAGIIAVAYNQQLEIARDNKSEVTLANLSTALDSYYDSTGSYPITCDQSDDQVLGCSYITNMYNTANGSGSTIGYTLPAMIKPTTTSAEIADILPSLKDLLIHPANPNGVPINRLVDGVVQPDSFFVLSTDLMPFQDGLDYGCDELDIGCIPGGIGPVVYSGRALLATNNDQSVLGSTVATGSIGFEERDGSKFPCSFQLLDTNINDVAGRRPHQYVLGYFSEDEFTWKFFVQSSRADLNKTVWNTLNQSSCDAQDISALKN